MARKRQAKLAFSPVSPDSPAAASLSPQVRNRAAAVALDGSPFKRPSKKRKFMDTDDDELSAPLPAPKKSYQQSPDARKICRNFREGMHMSAQTSMFGPGAYSHSSASGSSSESDAAPEAPKRAAKTRSSKKKQTKLADPVLAASKPVVASTGRRAKRARAVKDASDVEDAELPIARKTRSRKVTEPEAARGDDSEDKDEVQAVKAPSKRHTRSSKGKASPTVTTISAPKKQTRLQKNLTVVRPPSSDESSEEDSEDDVRPSVTQRSKKPEPQADASPDSSEADSDDEPRPSHRRIINRKRPAPPEDEETEGSEEHDGDHTDGGNEERDELLDELEDLRSSPFGGSQRRRGPKPVDKKQKALALLKKRRAAANASEPASTPGRKKAVIVDSDDVDSEPSLEIIDEEDEDEVTASDDEHEDAAGNGSDQFSDGGPTRARGRGRRTEAQDMFNEDEDDEDWIVDDANEPLGEPGDLSAMPLQYTNWNSKKPAELFKYAVEWMVKKKISPAFDSKDEIYDLAFRKLDDEVQGIANTRSSSVWTPAFTRAIRARPVINMNELGRMSELLAFCEACNRKSHPATWVISFAGKPYDKDTLEPLVEDKSSSEDESLPESDSDLSSASEASDSEEKDLGYIKGEKHEYTKTGELLPPESRHFNVGRTCAANARVTHTLYHWRYSLYTWVIEYLDKQGHTSGPTLVKLNKKSDRKREKAANKIVETMERAGETKKLHRLFRDQINVALMEKDNAAERRYGRRG